MFGITSLTPFVFISLSLQASATEISRVQFQCKGPRNECIHLFPGANLGECYLLGQYYPFVCKNMKTDNDR